MGCRQGAGSPFPMAAVASLRARFGPWTRGAATRLAAGVSPAERAGRAPGRHGLGTPASPAAGRVGRGSRSPPPPPPATAPGRPSRRAAPAALRRRRGARALAVFPTRGRRGRGGHLVAGPGRTRLLTGREAEKGTEGRRGGEREAGRDAEGTGAERVADAEDRQTRGMGGAGQ